MKKTLLVLGNILFFAVILVVNSNAGTPSIAVKKRVNNPTATWNSPSAVVYAISFPRGYAGQDYRFVVSPSTVSIPQKIAIVSGLLPEGLTVNKKNWAIEGRPVEPSATRIVIEVTDSKNTKTFYAGDLLILRKITLGPDGQFKDADGFQMALNMAQDMDEICIEKGVYNWSDIIVPENKDWTYGILISGGWDKSFSNNGADEVGTVLDGAGLENPIFTINNKVAVENIAFMNSSSGAVKVTGYARFSKCKFQQNINHGAVSHEYGAEAEAVFYDCIFDGNTSDESGGAIYAGSGWKFYNSTFINNSASDGGGAVYGGSTFDGCVFENNHSKGAGGAVSGDSSAGFYGCSFKHNSAASGGAVALAHGVTYSSCTFISNSATIGAGGGAVFGNGDFNNCVFISNSYTHSGDQDDDATGGGAVLGASSFSNCVFLYNSCEGEGAGGGAINGEASIDNTTFYGNTATHNGGAVFGVEKIMHSIFYKNTVNGEDNDIAVHGNLDIDYSLFAPFRGVANIGPNNITGDPLFVSPNTGNFALLPDSPGIIKAKLEPSSNAKGVKSKVKEAGKKVVIGADDALLSLTQSIYQQNFENFEGSSSVEANEAQTPANETDSKKMPAAEVNGEESGGSNPIQDEVQKDSQPVSNETPHDGSIVPDQG